MSDTPKELIILGIKEDGSRLRPSDWADRLAGADAIFEGGRYRYSCYLHPITVDGVVGVCLHCELKEENPGVYDFVLNFADANDLKRKVK